MKYSVPIVFVLCAAGVCLAAPVSRWFTASYQDLRFTLLRYGHCTGDLRPLRDYTLNETEYLIHQMTTFLDQGNYDNEQLANVSALMGSVCRSDAEQTYQISLHIDFHKFGNNHTQGKANRCRAIDEALDSMLAVFRRAASNRSEPLDFSVIQFYPNATDRSAHYNLTDLINTSWIASNTELEEVCAIANSVKRYVQARAATATNWTTSALVSLSSSKSSNTVEKRNEQQPRAGVFSTIFEMIDRILEPLLGFQNRLAWEGNNRLEMAQMRLSSGLGTIRDGLNNRIKSTRNRLSSMFAGSAVTNSSAIKSPAATNSSLLAHLNGTTTTQLPPLSLNMSATTAGVSRTSSVLQSTTEAPSTLPSATLSWTSNVAPSAAPTSRTSVAKLHHSAPANKNVA